MVEREKGWHSLRKGLIETLPRACCLVLRSHCTSVAGKRALKSKIGQGGDIQRHRRVVLEWPGIWNVAADTATAFNHSSPAVTAAHVQ